MPALSVMTIVADPSVIEHESSAKFTFKLLYVVVIKASLSLFTTIWPLMKVLLSTLLVVVSRSTLTSSGEASDVFIVRFVATVFPFLSVMVRL